jgi:hypothetical protein
VPDTDPRYNSGWNFLSDKNLSPNSSDKTKPKDWTGKKTPRAEITHHGLAPDTDPIYSSGWRFLSGKNLSQKSDAKSKPMEQDADGEELSEQAAYEKHRERQRLLSLPKHERSETVDGLVRYCRDNNRVCPQPQLWHRLWEMLPNRSQAGNGWSPPLPLILAAWQDTPTMMKMHRLAEHIQWAGQHGALDSVSLFLRGLREEDWFHIGD